MINLEDFVIKGCRDEDFGKRLVKAIKECIYTPDELKISTESSSIVKFRIIKDLCISMSLSSPGYNKSFALNETFYRDSYDWIGKFLELNLSMNSSNSILVSSFLQSEGIEEQNQTLSEEFSIHLECEKDSFSEISYLWFQRDSLHKWFMTSGKSNTVDSMGHTITKGEKLKKINDIFTNDIWLKMWKHPLNVTPAPKSYNNAPNLWVSNIEKDKSFTYPNSWIVQLFIFFIHLFCYRHGRASKEITKKSKWKIVYDNIFDDYGKKTIDEDDDDTFAETISACNHVKTFIITSSKNVRPGKAVG
jgi:hypothetical protein